MRVVVSHLRLVGFGGTESYVLTIGEELERLGHEVVVYAPETGPCAEHARARGIRVVDAEHDLPERCDALFAQDLVTAYSLAGRYPDAARIFVAHSPSYSVQFPPQAEGACHAVVVLNDRLLRRVRGAACELPVFRLRQPIDLRRFCFQTMGLEQRDPPRVLALSNYTNGARARMIEAACVAAGLELREVGQRAGASPAPEHEIAGAEIVISLGRGVLEAMASGRAAYVLGALGGDGWVTPDSYEALEADGFAGRGPGEAISSERLAAELGRWSEELGEAGRDLAVKHHAAEDHCLRLLELAEELGASPQEPPTSAGELARLARLEWGQELSIRSAVEQLDAERSRAAALEAEVSALRSEVDRLSEELGVVCGSRRYRFAELLARPVDALRR